MISIILWSLALAITAMLFLAAAPLRNEPDKTALEWLAERYARHVGRALVVALVAAPLALAELTSEVMRRLPATIRWHYRAFCRRVTDEPGRPL